jgi:transposase-like protein
MACQKRRMYSLEYELETVALVVEAGLSSQQVAKDLGVERSTVRVWVGQAEAGELAVPGGGPKTQSQLSAENKELRHENWNPSRRQGNPKKRRRFSRARSSCSLQVHRGGQRQPLRSLVVACREGRVLGVLRVA